MKKLIGKFMAMCFLSVSIAAFAQSGDTKQDEMKQDDMKQDRMKHDAMKKDDMKKDEMKKENDVAGLVDDVAHIVIARQV